jgi:hypothetical protein
MFKPQFNLHPYSKRLEIRVNFDLKCCLKGETKQKIPQIGG